MAPDTVRHLIGGEYAYSTLRKSYGVTDPATGKEYAQVEVGLGADVNQAVLAARLALESGPWPGMAAPDRARVLEAIADAIDARAGDIAEAQALGPGLPLPQGMEQAALASEVFRAAASLTAATDPDGPSPAPGRSCYTAAHPAGITGLITSWRTPFLSQARAVAAALAAGCTIVLKPDEWAPLPAALLAEVTIEAGLPGGVLNVVHGSLHRKAPGTQAQDALISHPLVARLSFAGEAGPGHQVALDAAAHGKKLSAELAGGSPCIIFADADLDQAADSALFGAFALGGQRRTATSVILVEQPAYDAMVTLLAERAARIRVGAPADPETRIGPLPHADHLDKLSSFVRLAVREGARLAAGGRRPGGLPEGSYLAPTVLADVTPSMQVYAQPVCGPLMRITPFDTDAEAVSLANAAKHRLAAYLWTADLDRAHQLAPAIETASTWVNSHNPKDLRGAPARPGAAAADLDLDFYTQSRSVFIAADDTPVPRF